MSVIFKKINIAITSYPPDLPGCNLGMEARGGINLTLVSIWKMIRIVLSLGMGLMDGSYNMAI
jgi:hypothetical protein